jgi:hypothetical protein
LKYSREKAATFGAGEMQLDSVLFVGEGKPAISAVPYDLPIAASINISVTEQYFQQFKTI